MQCVVEFLLRKKLKTTHSHSDQSAWTSFDKSITGQDYSKLNLDKTKSPFNQPLTGDPAVWSNMNMPWK
jgi:hypothetical protein